MSRKEPLSYYPSYDGECFHVWGIDSQDVDFDGEHAALDDIEKKVYSKPMGRNSQGRPVYQWMPYPISHHTN